MHRAYPRTELGAASFRLLLWSNLNKQLLLHVVCRVLKECESAVIAFHLPVPFALSGTG
jgi:hypothetical protein